MKMIDIEKVKEILKNTDTNPDYSRSDRDELFLAIKALDFFQQKATPVKPIEITHEEGENTYRLYHCPKCLNDEIDLYCNVCGQKIDWK
jgi:hypothetical protein